MKEIEELAETVKKQLKLKYDKKSVKFLEGFIERNKSNLQEEKQDGFVSSCGAFLGQCVIENYGCKWEKDQNGHLCVCLDKNNKAYPFAKVTKQFENGLGDSIYSFFSAIPIVFKIESKSIKKKWWKF